MTVTINEQQQLKRTKHTNPVPSSSVLHYLFLICIQTLALIHWCERFALFQLDRIRYLILKAPPTPSSIKSDVHPLSKLPDHVALVFTGVGCRRQHLNHRDGNSANVILEEVEEKEAEAVHSVGEMVCWCAAAGMSQLTIYDEHGLLERSSVQIATEIASQSALFFSQARSKFPTIQVLVSGIPIEEPPIFCAPATLRLNIISSKDGRQAIVNAAQTLAKYRIDKKMPLKSDDKNVGKRKSVQEDVTVESLHSLLTTNGLEEPQLVYVLTGVTDPLTLVGFPPWQIRLSEFWHVQGDGRLRYLDFIAGLSRYGTVHQRVGK
ncbi:hypothetical protein SmJEL517_g01332 [Synchytrium microbalum]|uniref:ditrans,polycis-polyprenyl diphosphate synthase [(2E,6E)-farnesyldiphosphate specific] n=1 Tax=Synchytrium microbalum TaxID=1806994 RepID=A0A507C4N2_9FUNG|nr:uncharacterized protein SmJEL517_g01332 [Synchytrium microbalum]TPX36500.1 hypothetical protein SmJEL517_g01332 [Synchytrium microbalum]